MWRNEKNDDVVTSLPLRCYSLSVLNWSHKPTNTNIHESARQKSVRCVVDAQLKPTLVEATITDPRIFGESPFVHVLARQLVFTTELSKLHTVSALATFLITFLASHLQGIQRIITIFSLICFWCGCYDP